MGVVSLLSEHSARSPTSPGRVSERQVLPLLGLGRGCSQRTLKAFVTAMRLCASLFRGVAAPLGCVICLQLGDVAVFSLCAQYFLNVRGGGGITTLGAFRTFANLPGPGVSTANFAAFGSWPGVLQKNAESLRNSDALMRGAVPRRRGPAGLRDPIAVSLTALMGFAVLVVHDNSAQGKILAGFTRWSVPCVLPLAAAPLLCPQHSSAADKTGRWKTGWAGSCRADFRFACGRPA